MDFVYPGFNCTGTTSTWDCVRHLAHDRSLFLSCWTWFVAHAKDAAAWVAQPHILAVVMAFWITFTVVFTIGLSIGFGPTGVIAGTIAAGIQSAVYGGFTPAGGIFATLTMLAMTGWLAPLLAIPSAFIATIVACIVWVCGAGR